ncbi:MAG: lytic murein transglycosylase [Methylobacteriaceae bacterium]|nr:lytic murein transglycosylase [Methylobacteriaceae bacterium]
MRMALGTVATLLATLSAPALAAPCGNDASGFAQWKQAFAQEARAQGVGAKAISALMATKYAHATIGADRNQKGMRLSFEEFYARRGGPAIIARGRALKRKHAGLFAEIERQHGVPAGPLLAIWGMETGFGAISGKQNMLSSVATLAYDCRRSAFFIDQLHAALTLIERGRFSGATRGSMHGEVGQTQFMPKAVLDYGVGSLETPAGALRSTAAFLKGHGWTAGAGYQPGEPSFVAIQGWNASTVYQRAIAHIGAEIDGD